MFLEMINLEPPKGKDGSCYILSQLIMTELKRYKIWIELLTSQGM